MMLVRDKKKLNGCGVSWCCGSYCLVAGMMNRRMLKLLVLLNLDVLQARYALAARGSIYLIMLLWPINSFTYQ